MFNLLLLAGTVSPVNGVEYPDNYAPSYFVDNVPVLRDATRPDNTILNIEYIYDQNAVEEPDEDSAIPENANTFDSVAGYAAIISILFALSFLLFRCLKKRRFNYRRILPSLLFVSLLSLLTLSLYSISNAATERFEAGPNSKKLYETITGMTNGASGTLENPLESRNSSGYYTYPGTENDAFPLTFYYSQDGSSSNANHVVFADKCWRIIRTTESGGVRLMYYGDVSDYATCEPLNTPDHSNKRTDNTYVNSMSSHFPKVDISTVTDSYGLYTYGDNFFDGVSSVNSNRDYYNTYPRTYSTAPAMLLAYTETSCYKRMRAGDFEGMNYRVDSQTGYPAYRCYIDTGRQYYASSFDYDDGHYYLVNSTYASEFPSGYIECLYYKSSTNSCGMMYHTPGVEDNSPTRVIEALTSRLKGNYICLASQGATMLSDGRVDCGDSIEFYNYIVSGSYKPFTKYTGLPKIMASGTNESSQKQAVDAWYENNLSGYTSRLADDVYCSGLPLKPVLSLEHSIEVDFNMTQSKPSLDCISSDKYTVSSERGNGALKYPVALLNYSDALLVGSASPSSDGWGDIRSIVMAPASMTISGNTSSRIQYRTFNLSNYSANKVSGVNSGSGTEWHKYELVPVITLAYNNRVVQGSGTSEDPFIIEGEKKPAILKNIKTFSVNDDALYNALVEHFSPDADYYSFSCDNDSKTITVDVNRREWFYFRELGIRDASALREFPYISILDLSFNELTKLPGIEYSTDSYYYFEGNHIRDLSSHIRYLKEMLESGFGSEVMMNFNQNLVVRYSNPNQVKTPPILSQYIQFIKDEKPYMDDYNWASFHDYFDESKYGIGTNNIDFVSSFKYATVPDINAHSYTWSDNLISHFWDEGDGGK